MTRRTHPNYPTLAARVAAIIIATLAWAAHGQSLLDELARDTEEPAEVAPSPLIEQFDREIERLELEQGAYGAGIAEQLLGKARILQQQNRHGEATEVLKRGVHLARVNGGLYSPGQIPLLRAEIDSLIALAEFSAVDERQRYLYRVERRSLTDGAASIDALLSQAAWQRDAFLYKIDPPEARPQRLTVMWDVYRLALNQMMDLYGSDAPELEPALEGMLTSQYLMAGYRGLGGLDDATEQRLTAYASEAYSRGRSVLSALMEVHATNNGNDPIVRLRDMQRLGDWSWWYGKGRPAMTLYREIWDTAMTIDEAGELAEELFGLPTPLPKVTGIEPLPTPTLDDSGDLVLTFAVSGTGRVKDLERIRNPEVEEEDKAVARLVRLVRKTRFRPRLVNGEPVATEGVIWSYNTEDWQYLE